MNNHYSNHAADLQVYLGEVEEYPELSPDEEAALAERAYLGDEEAAEQLTCCSLRLVVKVARRFRTGRSLADRIGDGNIGLIQAVKTYDPARGISFGGYAATLIRREICNGVDESHDQVHVSEDTLQARRRVIRARDQFLREHGREARDDELADLADLSEAQLRNVLLSEATGVSIDARPLWADGEVSIQDTLAGDGDTESEALASVEIDELNGVLTEVLDHRELVVVSLHYGLGSLRGKSWKLEEIATRLKMGRETVRLIELGALDKLRQIYVDGRRTPGLKQVGLWDFDESDLAA